MKSTITIRLIHLYLRLLGIIGIIIMLICVVPATFAALFNWFLDKYDDWFNSQKYKLSKKLQNYRK